MFYSEIQVWDKYDYLDSCYNLVMVYDNDLRGVLSSTND